MASTEHVEHPESVAEPDMRPLKMVRQILSLAVLSAVLLVGGSCRSRTDRTAGPVILTFGTITGIPTLVSVSAADAVGGVSIGTFTLQSIVKDPTSVSSSGLEDLEVTSYQVIYKRKDTGTRVPPPLVAALTLEVPVNSSGSINNLPIVRTDQLLSVPLSDLAKFGQDTETGTQVIVVDAQITFFGQTLSGDKVQSGTAAFTLEFTP
jgi:hypothetical protein